MTRFELGHVMVTIDTEDNLPPEMALDALDRHHLRVMETLRASRDAEPVRRIRSFFKFAGGWSCRLVTDLELNATLISMPNEIFRGERPALEARLYEESTKTKDDEIHGGYGHEHETKTRA